MGARKATTQQRQEMQRTQPKMVRHIDLRNGTDRMVIVEDSEVVKERKAQQQRELVERLASQDKTREGATDEIADLL